MKSIHYLPIFCVLFIFAFSAARPTGGETAAMRAAVDFPDVLPGTARLDWQGDIPDMLMDTAHVFIERKIAESLKARPKYWKRDFSSREAYERSIKGNRERFRKYIGVADERIPPCLERITPDFEPLAAAETERYTIYRVHWNVLDALHGEGVLLEPKEKPAARVIALPDADETPEMLCGMAEGIPAEQQFARKLAENGFQVIIPMILSRRCEYSGNTDLTHREWIYRQAFHMGRHIIGYEVQKILAALDWIEKTYGNDVKTGVAGYGEGGLLAFYAAAADTRIDAALVSGYFQNRQRVWDEPIYRNVWALLSEFGDAEIASLIAPHPLVIEYSDIPEIVDQPERYRKNPISPDGFTLDGYKGRLSTPSFESVKMEFDRIDNLVPSEFQERELVRGQGGICAGPGSTKALTAFSALLNRDFTDHSASTPLIDQQVSFDAGDRERRQLREMENHVQTLMKFSDQERDRFFLHKVMPELLQRRWSTEPLHPTYPPDKLINRTQEYRDYFWNEVLGKFDDTFLPPNPRTRKIYDEADWAGYEVVFDVFPGLFGYGILVIPKGIQPGEKRPLVVYQHGRNGTPKGTIEEKRGTPVKLAREGFIAFAHHNLYRGEDRYRFLDRKANTVKASLFSFILAQHEQLLNWLETLPFVDGARMGFYGISYGGETAVRVPPLLPKYCLSICSGDFNDWARKVASTGNRYTFMNTIEWEMPYFNMGNTFNYAELAYLMIPRPFMVERGHDDLVAPDEWVAYEYAKVRRMYNQLGLGDRTDIEFFNGGHAINLKGTLEFLKKHLDWENKEQ